jgi:hypothetical protein
MKILIILTALVVFAIAVILFIKRSRKEPDGWFAGPLIDGHNSSSVMTVDATGSFVFPTSPPGVHYVTEASPSLKGKTKLVMRYRTEADAGVTFHPVTDPTGVAMGPTLYLQRSGDKWQKDGWRWWATRYTTRLAPGEFVIEVPLRPEAWTSVETMTGLNNPDMLALAILNAGRIGFTFGGGADPNAGYGHGVCASGLAKFILLDFHAE